MQWYHKKIVIINFIAVELYRWSISFCCVLNISWLYLKLTSPSILKHFKIWGVQFFLVILVLVLFCPEHPLINQKIKMPYSYTCIIIQTFSWAYYSEVIIEDLYVLSYKILIIYFSGF